MTDSVLTMTHVSKHYGSGATRFDALKDISLDIKEGESIAIVGKSGSGKSTLMHILALLDTPSSGELTVVGKNSLTLKGAALNALRNQTFGFVFQQFFLTANATVLENVMLPLKISRMGRRERRVRAMAELDRLELGDKARSKAINLSGGQKQRAVIARALVANPRIIFADEPTGNLDSATGRVVEDILFELNRTQGITLVIVTHDEDLAARADRRIYIKDGEIVDHIDTRMPLAHSSAHSSAQHSAQTSAQSSSPTSALSGSETSPNGSRS